MSGGCGHEAVLLRDGAPVTRLRYYAASRSGPARVVTRVLGYNLTPDGRGGWQCLVCGDVLAAENGRTV